MIKGGRQLTSGGPGASPGSGILTSSTSKSMSQDLDASRSSNVQLPQSQTVPAKFKVNGPMNALSKSPDGTRVVLAGRDVLRVLNVSRDSSEITEETNFRVGRMNLNFSSNDVKWCPIPSYSNIIATAATNGALVVWDLNMATSQKQDRVINEHQRSINRVAFHPTEPLLLLSASQDGLVKLWDLRDRSSTSVASFEGKADGVRDAQFSPTDPYQFAAAYENGTVQRWDLRQTVRCEQRINAHSGPVFAAEWHPEGRYLATGSRDKTIRLWDMKSDAQKPVAQLQTITAVGRLAWRPGHRTQIASCALLTDRRIHIWDLQRVHVPLLTLDNHEDQTAGILFCAPDVIWSCSKDAQFIQSTIAQAYELPKLYNANTITWSPTGELASVVVNAPLLRDDEPQPITSNSSLSIANAIGKRSPMKPKIPAAPDRVALDGRLNLVPFKTNQVMFQSSPRMFDAAQFTLLAHRYVLTGDTPLALCALNARIAEDAGESVDVVQAWRIITTLFSEQEQPLMPLAPPPPPPPPLRFSKRGPSRETLQGEVFPGLVETLQTAVFAPVTWDALDIANETLVYYAETGNVQLTVSLLIVLRGVIKVAEEQEKAWFFAYIELLQRLRLWSVAAHVISLGNHSDITSMTQQSTTVCTSCTHCGKPMMNQDRHYYSCSNCRKSTSPCAICHITARGVIAWCQGCGHGGHVDHIQKWFAKYTACPAGCGHQCVVTVKGAAK